jgi:flagellar hook protein FlgE
MGMTSLNTGLSGLSTNQAQLDVVGNNIANINTVGFKSSRLDFKTQLLENFSYGTAPNGDLGGTNPLQIGLGASAGAVTRNFADGSLSVTGVPTNLALQGNGFFVLEDGTKQVYTRDGSFQLNGLNQLVSGTGQVVQGFGVDSSFNIVPGVLANLVIPVGGLTVAQATQNASMTGNLNSAGAVPTSVADVTLDQALYTSNGAGGINGGTAPSAATLLTDVADSTGANLFQVDDVLNFGGARGSHTVAQQTLTVTAATTLGDLQGFINQTLGINTAAGANGSIVTVPGSSLAAGTDALSQAFSTLTVDGNPGTENDLTLGNNALTISRAGSTLTPFSWTKNASANGESVATSMIIFDSLGSPVKVDMVASLMAKNANGSSWQYYADSPDNLSSTLQTVVGNGLLSFDTNGAMLTAINTPITIDRLNSGALPALTFSLDFSKVTALSGSNSQLASTSQDGSPPGTLTSFSVGNDGLILGSFTNGLSRKVGQIAVATFRNNQGLIDRGDNTFSTGPNSGTAVISAPQQFSAGRVVAGALELANVDLSAEFVNLIAASTGFSAASRVISTSNQLLQELLNSAR